MPPRTQTNPRESKGNAGHWIDDHKWLRYKQLMWTPYAISKLALCPYTVALTVPANTIRKLRGANHILPDNACEPGSELKSMLP